MQDDLKTFLCTHTVQYIFVVFRLCHWWKGSWAGLSTENTLGLCSVVAGGLDGGETSAPQKNKSSTVGLSRWFTRVEPAARNAFDSRLPRPSYTQPPLSNYPTFLVTLCRVVPEPPPRPPPPGGGMWTRVMEMDGGLLRQRGGTDGLLPKRPSASLHQSRPDSRRPLQ